MSRASKSFECRLRERRNETSELRAHGIFNRHVRTFAARRPKTLTNQQRFSGHAIGVVGRREGTLGVTEIQATLGRQQSA